MLLSLWNTWKKEVKETDFRRTAKSEQDRIMTAIVESPPPQLITNIEWGMMDKSKFYPLYTLSSFTVRCALYPLTLVKTQIQVQRKKEAYSGVADAISKIYRSEGLTGLYRGFWLSSFQIISGVFYISTYEGVRHELGKYDINPRLKSFIGGGCASIVGQTVIVPFDVLSQHLMVLGLARTTAHGSKNPKINPLGLDLDRRVSKSALAREVAARVYRLHGARGYYRGYGASLAAYVPNSALWWALYTAYQDELLKISPVWVSHLFIQCVAGTLGGFTTTILTNPLDIVRARLQVEGVGSMREVFKELWREEGLVGLYKKGLSARLAQSACFSFCVILGYESIKRVAVSDEYRPRTQLRSRAYSTTLLQCGLVEGLVGLYEKGLSARLAQSACFSCIILGYESLTSVTFTYILMRPKFWLHRRHL